MGSLPHNEVFEWLDTIDIYAQPSRQEGLPRALIEAMSRGLPAFGARTGGIPELLEPDYIISNNKNGINEICEILRAFNQEVMINQAKRNYDESKSMIKTLLMPEGMNFSKGILMRSAQVILTYCEVIYE